jgi:chromosome segregation ATPase
LHKLQAEVDGLKQDLAQEKMEKAQAQADLDAVQNKKPDTSEADSLRKELQALKDQHQAALMTSQQESAKATEEHLATKASLEKAQVELQRQKAESSSNYKDMHESLTFLVEEADKKYAEENKKASEFEAQLKAAEEASKKVSDLEARLKEAEANIKVKDAELAEAMVRSLWHSTLFFVR